jgi:hypothetical protein
MTRYLAITLLAAFCASCATKTSPDPSEDWSLALADPGYTNVYLGTHSSLETCQAAGKAWLNRSHEKTYTLECRLNCSSASPGAPKTCGANEPVK